MLGILLATAMLSTSAYAQITSGIVRGTVKDVTGGTIENANVTVVFVPRVPQLPQLPHSPAPVAPR